ncbi:hypothetical protein ACS0TY_026419 [Phlomoides rotata]
MGATPTGSMSCLGWNCRGLGNPRKVPALKKEILSKGPGFVFLCEIKLLRVELEGVSRKLGFDYYFGVDCEVSRLGRRGGVAILWRAEWNLTVLSYSHNHIDVEVGIGVPWRFTGIYGHLEEGMKWKTWKLLQDLSQKSSLPWLYLGDFNEIIMDREKVGGNVRPEGKMRAFRDCLDFCGLHDLGYVGHDFTWSKKQSGASIIQERLDRGWLVLAGWRFIQGIECPI